TSLQEGIAELQSWLAPGTTLASLQPAPPAWLGPGIGAPTLMATYDGVRVQTDYLLQRYIDAATATQTPLPDPTVADTPTQWAALKAQAENKYNEPGFKSALANGQSWAGSQTDGGNNLGDILAADLSAALATVQQVVQEVTDIADSAVTMLFDDLVGPGAAG